ncbi:MAG: hypothetical protein CMK09_15215 [Ponticaulis sp.]|nr:hypothetical protein [Ponticaulis sp.]|tara:strand:- start:16226 stop:17080 length:855 start_codon:yes stop_codon:yes gene_type:complete
MKRTASILLMAAMASTSIPALAANHNETAAKASDMSAVLASDIRTEDSVRDEYRNPADTLSFFGITPDMTVGEYSPGGGWYTRVLAPYLAAEGKYVAVNTDVDGYMAGSDPERIAAAKTFPETFPGQVEEWTGISADRITAYEIDEAPEDAMESLDAMLVFRALHGLTSREMVDSLLGDTWSLLKPGGLVGVVQHRAKEDAPRDFAQGARGYLKQSEVIAIFESEGFEFVGSSEVNANPNDPADHEGGVWTLPPTLRFGDENKAEYEAIGESDRMTLLFKKPEA